VILISEPSYDLLSTMDYQNKLDYIPRYYYKLAEDINDEDIQFNGFI
jgi:hypothetical protein